MGRGAGALCGAALPYDPTTREVDRVKVFMYHGVQYLNGTIILRYHGVPYLNGTIID